jgi:hypothetical protein
MSKTKLHTKQIRPAATIANAPSGKVVGVSTGEVIPEYKNGYKHININNLPSNLRNILHTSTSPLVIRESELTMAAPTSPNTTVLVAGVDTSNNKFTTDGNQRLTLVNNSDTPMFIISKFINDSQAGRFNLMPYGITPLYARTAYDFYYRDTGFMMVSPVSQNNTAGTYNINIRPFAFPTTSLQLATTNTTITEIQVNGVSTSDTKAVLPSYRIQSSTNPTLPNRATVTTTYNIHRPNGTNSTSVLIRYTFYVGIGSGPSASAPYNLTCRLGSSGNATEADPVNTVGVRLATSGSNYIFQVFSKDGSNTSTTMETSLSDVIISSDNRYVVELLLHHNRQVTATVNKVYIGTVTSSLIDENTNCKPSIHFERSTSTFVALRIDVESITIETLR